MTSALVFLIVCLLALTGCAGSGASRADAGATLAPTNLRCEYLVNPTAIDTATPRLSWELRPLTPGTRGLSQAAYEIEVFTEIPEKASDPQKAVLWTTGKVASGETCQIEYAGAKFAPGFGAKWQVRVWDQAGRVSAWSPPASWTRGLTSKEWEGVRWIGDPTPAPAGFGELPAPMLRKQFAIPASGRQVVRATAYVSALGLYELRLNGQRVGDHVLAPEWTDYTKRVQFQTYDVTAMIRTGENCIGAILGDGWFAGKVGLAGIVPKGPPRAIYGRQPRLFMQLEVRFADGTSESIVSDDSWRSTIDGPIRTSDIMDGETYDARREMPGWDSPGFDAAAWSPVRVCEAPTATVVAQPNEPVRVNRTIKPIAITEPKPGVYVFDLGQNMVGWCRVQLAGKPGETITLHHAEVLNPDGTIYYTNLRGAHQTDRYTFRTDAAETFEPRFTYHGFRYVEVTGLSTKPALDSIVGCVVNSSSPEVGTFECSEPMLNRLWQNILWTQRGNLVGVPTDCPQRDERCGWMGDILAFAPTACYNMDMAGFLTKWVPDTRDAQALDGRFADFSPHPYQPDVRFSGVAAWGDAGVFVPWAAYQFYGDTRMLAEQFDAAKAWIEFIHSKNPDLLWKHSRGNDYGDWLNADTLKLGGGAGWPAKGAEVPKHVFATIFFFRSTQIVSEMASVLGHTDEAKKYAELAEAIRAAFVKAYVQADGKMEGDTQAGYALALHFGLIPESLQSAAVDRMVDRFKPYDGQISTGFHSTLPLMTQLSARGRNDEAYRLLLNRKMPSWGYEVDHGATTIWERWDGWVEGRGYQDPGMNSFAHYAIGAVGEWMYGTMLGIQPTSPGFATVDIHPRPGPGVKWARGSYHSIRGPIVSGWERTDESMMIVVSIPPNVVARIFLPTKDVAKASIDGKPLAECKDVIVQGVQDGSVVCRVGSGDFVFFVAR